MIVSFNAHFWQENVSFPAVIDRIDSVKAQKYNNDFNMELFFLEKKKRNIVRTC